MFKVSIFAEKTHEYYIDYLKRNLIADCSKGSCIVSDFSDSNNVGISFECFDEYENLCKEIIKEHICEVLCVGFKNEYLREKMMLCGKQNIYIETLINTMCHFDGASDKKILKDSLNLKQPIFLEGYYNFMMKNQKKRWSELVQITNENGTLFFDQGMCIDFLNCMLDSIPTLLKELSLDFFDGKLNLYNSSNKILRKKEILWKNSSCEEEAVLNVVWFKPEKVKIYSNTTLLSDDFKNIICSLFDTTFVN